jgi:hypothetical protein
MDKVRQGIPDLNIFEAAQVYAVIAEKLAGLEAVSKVVNEATYRKTTEEYDLRGIATETIDAVVLGETSVNRPAGAICRPQ